MYTDWTILGVAISEVLQKQQIRIEGKIVLSYGSMAEESINSTLVQAEPVLKFSKRKSGSLAICKGQ